MLSSDNGDFFRAIAGGKSASGQIEFVKRYGSSAPVDVLAPLIDKVRTEAFLFSSLLFSSLLSSSPLFSSLLFSPLLFPEDCAHHCCVLASSTIMMVSIHPSMNPSIHPCIHESIHPYPLSDWDLEAMIGLHR